jgi:TonB family protein
MVNCIRRIAAAACLLVAGTVPVWAISYAVTLQDNGATQKSTDPSGTNADQPEKKDRKVYRLVPGMTPPKLVSSRDIDIEKGGKKLQFEGVAVVSLEVNTQGIPKHVRVVRSAAQDAKTEDKDKAREIDEKTLEAVREYRFLPATSNGRPISVLISIEVKFHISK